MRSFVVVLGLLLPFVLSAPVEEKVLVPGVGYVSKSNAHEVPAGASISHVGDEVRLVSATGRVLHSSKIDASSAVRRPEKRAASGWIVAGTWTNPGTSPIKTFTTKWTVPPVPRANNGQTVFLFNAIEPNTYNAILQPVLQYGPSAAGGGAYWAVASWYISPSNQVFYTTPVRTTAGTVLTGVINLTSSSGNVYNYSTSFTGISGTTLAANGGGQLIWATETLEGYGIVTEATNYPTGTTTFSAIGFTFVSTAPTVSWGISDWDTSDKITGSISANGATNAAVVIHYPTA